MREVHGIPISDSQVWRICRPLDRKPWQVQSWMTFHDPAFDNKADVCGLYLHPQDDWARRPCGPYSTAPAADGAASP